MNATFAITIGREVFVYVRGQLVMKRWLETGRSVTFHVAPAGVRWNDDFCIARMARDVGNG